MHAVWVWLQTGIGCAGGMISHLCDLVHVRSQVLFVLLVCPCSCSELIYSLAYFALSFHRDCFVISSRRLSTFTYYHIGIA